MYAPPRVVGVADDDPDGYIPEELLAQGIEVLVPIWPNPADPGQTDKLIVEMKRNGVVVFSQRTEHPGPIAETQFTIAIGPAYLVDDGIVEVMYTTLNHFNNPAYSLPRKLTIDHTLIPKDLTEPNFPAANRNGYLNCSSEPPIWEGVEVKVPTLPDFVRVGDVCSVEWTGYLTLNGSGAPIAQTYKKIDKTIMNAQEIAQGFSVLVEPYRPHIEPMQKLASALANYTLYRGGRRIGVSLKGLVKIDRVIPGEEQLCGP
ncbi:hypothetical protein [Pseudomonas sp. NPDC089534]|uniref:hypothetical protein n=1 Tax=Pseudomonas sp. NPDC089534 TaxID=3364468 RepID=UPI0037FFEA57